MQIFDHATGEVPSTLVLKLQSFAKFAIHKLEWNWQSGCDS